MKLKFVAAMVAVAAMAGSAAGQPNVDEIGSLRNARVAYPIPAGEKPRLVFLSSRLVEDERAELAKIAPNVEIITGVNRESALEYAARAQGVEARLISPEFLEKATGLVWVHSPSAGVDWLVGMDGLKGEKIVLTNSRAVHGPAIADHAFGMLLTLTRNLRAYEAAQAKREWLRDSRGNAVVLQGKTMLVVGIGGIGEEIARRAHGFGMRVIATRRSDAPAPAYVEKVGKPGDLVSMLPGADVIAVCVPLTAETEGMLGKKEFAAIKKGSYLINIARGKVVDSGAMVAALKDGTLAGACLDVTDPEPLPAGDELWKMQNVIITPHVAADGELTRERGWALLRENVRRFGAGEPLLNVVDMKAGY